MVRLEMNTFQEDKTVEAFAWSLNLILAPLLTL